MEPGARRVPRSGLSFEELAPGTRFATPARTVTPADVALFAGLSGDQNPIHTDAEFARRTAFRRPVAHGLLVQSIATGLAHRAGVFDGTIVAITSMDIEFERPVFPGDTLQAELAVVEREAEPGPRRGWVRFAVEVKNQAGETVNRGHWRTLMHRSRAGLAKETS